MKKRRVSTNNFFDSNPKHQKYWINYFKNDPENFIDEAFSLLNKLNEIPFYHYDEFISTCLQINDIFLTSNDPEVLKKVEKLYSALYNKMNVTNIQGKDNKHNRKRRMFVGQCRAIILEQINKSLNTDECRLIRYLIFEEGKLPLVSKYIIDNEFVLNTKYNGNTLLYDVIKYYSELDKDSFAIDYYLKVINIILSSLSPKLKKEELEECLLLLNNRDEEHINVLRKKLINQENVDELLKRYNMYFEFAPFDYSSIDNRTISKSRIDYTNLLTLTIDGAGDQCLDDAFSIVKHRDGTYSLYVHIIDMNFLAPKESSLDLEAKRRGETLFLNNRNITMYPEYITNNIGSLLPNEKRCTITFEIKLDSNMNFIGNSISDYFSIHRGLITSSVKLSYATADEILSFANQNDPLYISLIKLYQVSEKLKKKNPLNDTYHKIKNAYNNNQNQVMINESNITDVSLSANIVQELMILINRLVPEYLAYLSIPCLFRNNKTASREEVKHEMAKIKEYINKNGIEYNNINYEALKNFYQVLLSNARYSNINLGHDGIGTDYYSHSTSPARRYADDVIQQIINQFIFEKYDDKMIYYYEGYIEGIANHLNDLAVKNSEFCFEYNSLVRRRTYEYSNNAKSKN